MDGKGSHPRAESAGGGRAIGNGFTAGDYTRGFVKAIFEAGLEPPDHIKADGHLHRFSSNGKRSDDAGWYVLHADGVPAGAFGDWRTDINQSWRANIGRELTPGEERTHRARGFCRCASSAPRARAPRPSAPRGSHKACSRLPPLSPRRARRSNPSRRLSVQPHVGHQRRIGVG